LSRWVGIDVGGQALKAAVVDDTGRVLDETSRPTGPSTSLDSVATLCAGVLAALECTPGVPLGLGVAGCVTLDGVVKGSPNLPALKDVPLGELLAGRLGRRVCVDNDAHCHALAEGWTGAARGERHFVLITLGSGVGSALVLDGTVYRGATGFGCELGHLIFQPDGRRCGCGNQGCLEAYVSEVALRTRIADDVPRLAERVEGRVAARSCGYAEALFALADSGDVDAAGLGGRLCEEFGIAIASVVNLFDVELIVLGGGIAPAFLARAGRVRESMARALFARSETAVRLVPASAGVSAGAVGAARMAMLAV
jgi:glucokinase